MRDALTFRRLSVPDLFAIEGQASQAVQFGIAADIDDDLAALLAGQTIAWSAIAQQRLIACFGIVEQFADRQGLGWAVLAEGIGANLVPLTRFVAAAIATSGLARVEIFCKAPDLEPLIARHPGLDAGQLVALALQRPTREMRWAACLGLTPGHVLRCYGAASETWMLYEHIAPPAFGTLALIEAAA